MDRKGIVSVINALDIPLKDELIYIVTEGVDFWHANSKPRVSGEQYGDHPREAVAILSGLWPIPIYVFYGMAAHDAKEHSNDLREIVKIIGPRAGALVEGMTEDKVIYIKDPELIPDTLDEYRTRKARYHQKFEEYWGIDPFLIITKFPDLLHNCRTIQHLMPERQLRYLDEARFFTSFYRIHIIEMRRLFATSRQIEVVRGWVHELDAIIAEKYPEQAGVCS